MIKSEKGSITVFTLSACLLMMFILVGIFMGVQSKTINQQRQLDLVQNNYNIDDQELEEKYNKVLQETNRNVNRRGCFAYKNSDRFINI